MRGRPEAIVGLDIGTTKICALVAEPNESGELEVKGLSLVRSRGMRKGVIVDLDGVIDGVSKVISEVSQRSGVNVTSVYVGVAGSHISTLRNRGVTLVSGEAREITFADLNRVMEAAQTVSIPQDKKVIHILPMEFIVDGQRGIKDPVGMAGIKLEAEVLIILGSYTSIQSTVNCVTRAGLNLEGMLLEPIASAEAVLSPTEKELGALVVDIGGGTTDIAVFFEGNIRHAAVIPVGGDHITSDIAAIFKIPLNMAEEIKIKYGCASVDHAESGLDIELKTVLGKGGSGSKISHRELCDVIEARVGEIFLLVKENLKKSQCLMYLPAGVVLTGGVALLKGIDDLAMRILDLPVRVGKPREMGGLSEMISSPIFSTVVGLVKYGFQQRGSGEKNLKTNSVVGGGWLSKLKEKLIRMFVEFF
ncbi:MAG: cell division protein FtsA [Synergistetes bacterium]|nr:cell division protein FtsA [Synergistota bacterium]MCX8127779.1 cell division protein FtsA [Synergistota bacterium]MDW8192041.1 cell division protein FtsA [Synergistota bacterium]